MLKFFKALAGYFKAIGWKNYLLYLFLTVVIVAVVLGSIYAAALLFNVSTLAGVLGVVWVLIVIFAVQYFIMRRGDKKRYDNEKK